MELKINIDDKQLQYEVTQMISRKLTANWSPERQVMKRMIAESVKEVVYSQKDFIIDMVVNRATREIRNKALPKLLENLGKEL